MEEKSSPGKLASDSKVFNETVTAASEVTNKNNELERENALGKNAPTLGTGVEEKSSSVIPLSRNDTREGGKSSVQEMTTAKLVFEDLLYIVGGSGFWQLKILLLASFSGCCTGIHHLIHTFIGDVPAHWCQIPTAPLYTYNEMKEMVIPKDDEHSSCFHYAYEVNVTGFVDVNRNVSFPCSDFDFNQSVMHSSIPTEFELVCDGTSLAPAIQSLYMLGIMVGSPTLGALADQLGRKKTILLSSVIFLVAGFLISLAPNIWTILVLRFILGFGAPGIYATSYVLAIEVVANEWRSKAGSYFNIPFAFGYVSIPLAGYYVREWRQLQFILCIPSIILLATWYYLPESPRWLISKGKIEEAEKVLREIAKMNGMVSNIPSNFRSLLQLVHDGEQCHDTPEDSKNCLQRVWNFFCRYLNVLRSPTLSLRLFILAFCWFAISLTYYGLAFYSNNLDANKYTYLAINAGMEIPAYFLIPLLIDYGGRKPIFIGLLLTCGMCLITGGVLKQGAFLMVMVYMGKFASCIVYALIYLFASELMPTSIRTYAIGMASMVGRLGSTSAPVLVDVLGGEHSLSCYVFGSLVTVGGLLSFMLPETLDKRLPATMDDI